MHTGSIAYPLTACVVVLASCTRTAVETNPTFEVSISGDTTRLSGRAILTRCSRRLAHLWLQDSSTVGTPMVYFTLAKVGTRPGRYSILPSTSGLSSDRWVIGLYYSADTMTASLSQGDLVLEDVRDGSIRGQFLAQLQSVDGTKPRSITGRFNATRDAARESMAYQLWPKCEGPAPF